jgi:hypothetical protein
VSLFAVPVQSQAVGDPVFRVDASSDGVWGHDWSTGSVDVSIAGGPSWTVPVSDGSDGQNPGDFSLDLGNSDPVWDVVSGDEITVAHTSVSESKTHTVTELTAAYDTDSVVVGAAAIGSDVDVWVHDTDPNVWRHEVATGGAWSADFAVAGGEGGEEHTIDLDPGTNGAAAQCEADGDCTFAHWRVADLPSFSVLVDEGQVHGGQWPLGTDVTLEIDDPGNGVGVDYSETLAPEEAEWDPDQTFVGFDTAGAGWTLEAGQLVSMSNGDVTKTHTVTDLEITVVDEAADIVSGTTSSGFGSVSVDIYDDGGGLDVPVVAGAWLADFSGMWDIAPGTNGEAHEYDDDGDSTRRSWGVANPGFSVETLFDVWSTGDGWIEGATASLSVDDGTGGGPEHTDTVLIERWGPSPWEVGFNFHTDPFEILPGFVVTVDDGVTVKVLDVVGVTVDIVDPDTDIVAGTAPGDTWVSVNGGNEWDGCGFDVFSEADGSWVADFSGDPCFMDLVPGFGGSAQVYDDDGDSTHRSWNIANPMFNVAAGGDSAWGHEWSFGTVEVSVDGVSWMVPVSEGSDDQDEDYDPHCECRDGHQLSIDLRGDAGGED